MPRIARRMSDSGIYHVMVRGINGRDIFLEQEDYLRYLDTLEAIKGRSGCLIHGYCLMSNHAHLLLQEGEEDVGQIMKRIGASYVRWFNAKYQRIGHLFQDRFRSEAVEDDAYFLVVLRYIHQNPLKAGITSSLAAYPWSSYRGYVSPEKAANELISREFALGMLGGLAAFIKFSTGPNETEIQLRYVPPATDKTVMALLADFLSGRPASDLQALQRVERDKIITKVKSASGATNAQIARLTGLSLSIVQRATSDASDGNEVRK